MVCQYLAAVTGWEILFDILPPVSISVADSLLVDGDELSGLASGKYCTYRILSGSLGKFVWKENFFLGLNWEKRSNSDWTKLILPGFCFFVNKMGLKNRGRLCSTVLFIYWLDAELPFWNVDLGQINSNVYSVQNT